MSTHAFSVRQLIGRDIERYLQYSSDFSGDRSGTLRRWSSLLTPSLLCCLLYRLAHRCQRAGLRWLARLITRLNYLLHKAQICPGSRIGPGLYIPHTVGIVFEGQAGEDLTLYALAIVTAEPGAVRDGGVPSSAPRLGDKVTVGAYATVYGAIEVADNCTIGPTCQLQESIPANTVLFAQQRSEVLTEEAVPA